MAITEFLDPEFVRDRLNEDLTTLRDDVRGVDDRTLTHVYDRLRGMLGTVPVVQAVEELKGGTIDQVVGNVTVQATNLDIRDLTSASDSIAIVQGGGLKTGATLSVDNIGLLKTADQPLAIGGATIAADKVGLAKASGVPVSATLTQDNVGLFRGGGTVTQIETPRTPSYGTLASAFPIDGVGQVPGTADVETLDGFSLGMTADGTVEVSHQMQTALGGSWREDGIGTLVTNEERISTINHKAFQYRPSLTNMDASSTVSVNMEWMGN